MIKPGHVPHGHLTSVAAVAFTKTDGGDRTTYRCIDGTLTAGDIAKAAGCSAKQVKRALEAASRERDDVHSFGSGSSLDLSDDDLPPPGEATRGAVALIVAAQMGLGRFGLKKRIAERAARKPKGDQMNIQHHPWKLKSHGRSVTAQEGGAVIATLTCSKCPNARTIRFRQLCGAADMDAKFKQQGWAVDPAKCPTHNRHNHSRNKETTMASTATAPAKTSPAAIAAQAKMFGLLQMHFDTETGVYGSGYSDRKIAEDCGLAVELVAGVRAQAFGELKVPAEVGQLTADIAALESLLEESIAPIQSELRALKQRVTDCCRKFGG